MLAGDVMTRKVISVASDASAMQAGALMLKHQISGLPVVDFERDPARHHQRGRLSAAGRARNPASPSLDGWRF